jgi:ribonucleoside-diphosphate reductase alpha chain
MNHVELNNLITKKHEDGFFQLEYDQEAIKAFQVELQDRLIKFDSIGERMDYLIQNNYYYNVYEQYTKDEVKEIHQFLYAKNFQFQSYMAIAKFYEDYALKTNDKKKFLESYEDRIAIVSLYLGRGKFEDALLYADQIIKNVQPATPTFLNAGKARRGELVSCFLLEMDDSLNSIGFYLNTCMQLSKIGGGVAVNLSKLRGRGEEIKGIEGAAKGIMPVLKLMEDSFSYADQMGQRKGSGAAYYNIFGSDIMEFLDTKKINADEKSRLKTLSLGLIADKIFFDLAERNEDMYVFYPYSVFKAYGVHLDEMDLDTMYYKLLQNDKVKKKKLQISARELIIKICTIELESGYPYFMYRTNANKNHPLRKLGRVKMSNLCTEIFQLQEPSTINNYGEKDHIGRDINCNLASLDVNGTMVHKEIRKATHAGIQMLTAVSDLSNIENAPTAARANRELHSVGLGIMNLQGYLAKNKIAYTTKEARDFANTYAMMVNFYSIEKSMMIAKDTGIKFDGFEQSDYADGSYFSMYLEKSFAPEFEKVAALFEGQSIPTPLDWYNLMLLVQQYGLYNAYRLAIAPTGSISYIRNATPSVMPCTHEIEPRTYGTSTTYFPAPFLSRETKWMYAKSAFDMDQNHIIDMVAVIQQHVDQGISCTLFVDGDISTRKLARYYIRAGKKGLKSIYYTRTRNKAMEECLSCTV